MDESFQKNKMTKESFNDKRRDLFSTENWKEYEKLLSWHYETMEKNYGDSLEIVSRALNVPV